jgi:DNA-binding NtrC family response regulator
MRKSSDFTILFAEDNPAMQAVYVKAFEREGYKVFTADNAAQVMAELHEGKFDLLVTDLEMPAANTFELFPFLKKEYPKLPVIIVSGHYKDLQTDFLDKGYRISAFLNKPIAVSVLKEKIEEILRIGEE